MSHIYIVHVYMYLYVYTNNTSTDMRSRGGSRAGGGGHASSSWVGVRQKVVSNWTHTEASAQNPFPKMPNHPGSSAGGPNPAWATLQVGLPPHSLECI